MTAGSEGGGAMPPRTPSTSGRVVAGERGAPRPLYVELVGLAGIGKTHLKSRLLALFGERCLDLVAFHPPLRDLRLLPAAWRRAAPLAWFVLTSRSRSQHPTRRAFARAKVPLRLLSHAWREEAVARMPLRPDFVLSEEGWFHKLRRLRRFLPPGTTYLDLPPAARQRAFRPDVVLFLTADPMEVCRRKLTRSGGPITPESLARQFERSGARGQWEEDGFSRVDLAQASVEVGLQPIEFVYDADFDVAGELVPMLERLRQCTAERSSSPVGPQA